MAAVNQPRIEFAVTPRFDVFYALYTLTSTAATPLDAWKQWATNVRGAPVDSGHFLTEENPEVTGRMLREFFLGG